jgi:hypothetical protein
MQLQESLVMLGWVSERLHLRAHTFEKPQTVLCRLEVQPTYMQQEDASKRMNAPENMDGGLATGLTQFDHNTRRVTRLLLRV